MIVFQLSPLPLGVLALFRSLAVFRAVDAQDWWVFRPSPLAFLELLELAFRLGWQVLGCQLLWLLWFLQFAAAVVAWFSSSGRGVCIIVL